MTTPDLPTNGSEPPRIEDLEWTPFLPFLRDMNGNHHGTRLDTPVALHNGAMYAQVDGQLARIFTADMVTASVGSYALRRQESLANIQQGRNDTIVKNIDDAITPLPAATRNAIKTLVWQGLGVDEVEAFDPLNWGTRFDLITDDDLQFRPPDVGRLDPLDKSAPCLLYSGEFNLLWGVTGSGKTFLAQYIALQEATDSGRPCLYLDFEDTTFRRAARRMIHDMQMGDEQRGLIHHKSGRVLTAQFVSQAVDVANALADKHGVAPFVVLDSIERASAAMQGGPADANERWKQLHAMLMPIPESGACLTGIDHESPKTSYEYDSTGSHRKRADVSGASIKVVKVQEFTRFQAGSSNLIVSKDREGYVRTGTTIAVFEGGPMSEGGFCLRQPTRDESQQTIRDVDERIAIAKLVALIYRHPEKATLTNLKDDGSRFFHKDDSSVPTGDKTVKIVKKLLDPASGPMFVKVGSKLRCSAHVTAAHDENNFAGIDLETYEWTLDDEV